MLIVLFSLLALGFFYWFVLRRWFLRWGATAAEVAEPAGGTLSGVNYSATLAITIAATPDLVWPWLAQIGYRRGGLYSYDWLDRLFGYLDSPSTNEILPEFQELRVGDEIPIGRAGGFPVRAVERNRVLPLGGGSEGLEWLWEFRLSPIDGRTRLVSRSRGRTRSTLRSWLFMRLMEPAAFLMTRRMLVGLKYRAERLARDVAARSTRAASPQSLESSHGLRAEQLHGGRLT